MNVGRNWEDDEVWLTYISHLKVVMVTHAAGEVWRAARVRAWRQIGGLSQPHNDPPCPAVKCTFVSILEAPYQLWRGRGEKFLELLRLGVTRHRRSKCRSQLWDSLLKEEGFRESYKRKCVSPQSQLWFYIYGLSIYEDWKINHFMWMTLTWISSVSPAMTLKNFILDNKKYLKVEQYFRTWGSILHIVGRETER